MTEFFIADTHYGSFNMSFNRDGTRLRKAGLTAESAEQTDENWVLLDHLDQIMLQNWNNKVKSNDTVYFLGDLATLRTSQQWTNWLIKLHGRKIFIVGNHDQSRVLKYAAKEPKTGIIEIVMTAKLIKRNKQELWLSHYPTLLSTRMVNIHGHIHNRLIETMLVPSEDGGDVEKHRFFNVGVDADDMQFLPIGAPISIEELLARLPKW